nr:hypothetical protein [Tanacetum cinerariifolium]
MNKPLLKNQQFYHNLILSLPHLGETQEGLWISQSKVPSPGADETAFPSRDVRYGEAFLTDTSLDAGQDRGNIAKTSAMPHEALPRVTSLGGGEGIGDTMKDSDKSTNKGSASTDEMSHVLGSLRAENILASGGLSVATPTTRVTRSSRGVVIRSSSLISVNIPSISKKDKGKGKMKEHEQPSKEELDMSNEMIAKYLSEYEQAAVGLSHDEKEKMQDFVPMNSKLESERLKRPGIQLDKERSKKLKTAEASGTEPSQEPQSEDLKELSEEELKKMMNTTEVIDEKAKELWVELKRLYEPDSRDPLWALQRLSVPTADVYIAKKLATVEDFALLHEDKIYSESKMRDSLAYKRCP